MTDDEKMVLKKLVDAKAAELAEHFDSVQIMVTRHSGGRPRNAIAGRRQGKFLRSPWTCSRVDCDARPVSAQ